MRLAILLESQSKAPSEEIEERPISLLTRKGSENMKAAPTAHLCKADAPSWMTSTGSKSPWKLPPESRRRAEK